MIKSGTWLVFCYVNRVCLWCQYCCWFYCYHQGDIIATNCFFSLHQYLYCLCGEQGAWAVTLQPPLSNKWRWLDLGTGERPIVNHAKSVSLRSRTTTKVFILQSLPLYSACKYQHKNFFKIKSKTNRMPPPTSLKLINPWNIKGKEIKST